MQWSNSNHKQPGSLGLFAIIFAVQCAPTVPRCTALHPAAPPGCQVAVVFYRILEVFPVARYISILKLCGCPCLCLTATLEERAKAGKRKKEKGEECH